MGGNFKIELKFIGNFEPKLKCFICKKLVKEGYSLQPSNDEEFRKTEELFTKDCGDWLICEDCVLGKCKNPNEWWRLVKQKGLNYIKNESKKLFSILMYLQNQHQKKPTSNVQGKCVGGNKIAKPQSPGAQILGLYL